MRRRLLFTAMALLVCFGARAQFFRKLDELLKSMQENQPYDTTYIYRPQQRWLIRTQSIFSGESMNISRTGASGDDYGLHLGSGLRFKQTIGGGYRNIVLDAGYSFLGGNRNYELELRIHGNRIGVNTGMSIALGLEGTELEDGIRRELPKESLLGVHTHFDAYYSLNGKRFSMPAASCQSFIQRKSAGSPLATVSAQGYGALVLSASPPNTDLQNVITLMLGAGGGYGYNWVPSEQWLIHASLTETIGFIHSTGLTLGTESERLRSPFPIFVTKGTLAVMYYIKNWYVGFYAVANNYALLGAKADSYRLARTTSRANITAGVRF